MGPDELFQRAVIARRYYLEGRTRVEIAEEFGLSRFKVARMLEEALESGMVEITIHDPGSIDVDLSAALQKRYALQHAYAVVAQSKNTADRVEAVAKAMADLLQSILREDDVIGIDCGRTMTRIAPYLQRPAEMRRRPTDRPGRRAHVQRHRPDPADLRGHRRPSPGRCTRPSSSTDARTAREPWPAPPRSRTPSPTSPASACALVSVGGGPPRRPRSTRRSPRRRPPRCTRRGCARRPAGCCSDADGTPGRPGSTSAAWASTEEGLRAIPTSIAICCRQREGHRHPGRAAAPAWCPRWSPTSTSPPRSSIDRTDEER